MRRRHPEGDPARTRGRQRSDNGCVEPPVRLIMAAVAAGMIVGALLSPGAASAERDASVVEVSIDDQAAGRK